VESLVALLNAGIVPAVPEQGSVGASGDLAPLSHIAMVLIGEGEVLGVCLLANYRGNGPYNDFMWRYHNSATWFPRFLRGLHVLTLEPERHPDRPQYFHGEDQVRADGLPLEMLLEDGHVTAAVQQTTSPLVVLLDRHRRVRYEGDLGSVDLWNTLASMSAPASV
jgi:hypothetical protein